MLLRHNLGFVLSLYLFRKRLRVLDEVEALDFVGAGSRLQSVENRREHTLAGEVCGNSG